MAVPGKAMTRQLRLKRAVLFREKGEALNLRLEHESTPIKNALVFLVVSRRVFGLYFPKAYRILYRASKDDSKPLSHSLAVRFI